MARTIWQRLKIRQRRWGAKTFSELARRKRTTVRKLLKSKKQRKGWRRYKRTRGLFPYARPRKRSYD